MERNTELLKAMLQYMEEVGTIDGEVHSFPEIQEYTPEQIAYHAYLLEDAGFGLINSYMGVWSFRHLTWAGHDFLDRLKAGLTLSPTIGR